MKIIVRTIIACFGIFLLSTKGVIAAEAPVLTPLPIDVALSVQTHDERSSLALSPDGAWIAHTIQTADILPSASPFFTATGVPLSDGRNRLQVHLVNTRTGEDIVLGGGLHSSWSPSWSPDGKHIAYYSDEGGSAGVWIWDLSTRKSERFPAVIARPFFLWEIPRWSADGQSILVKILPANLTIADANALTPKPAQGLQFPKHDDDAAGVLVLHAGGENAASASDMAAFTNRSWADLARLDLRTHHAQRIGETGKILWYAFSPDQRSIAYTQIDTALPNEQRLLYRVNRLDLNSGRLVTIGRNIGLSYGIELSWSPDSHGLALIEEDAAGATRLAILPSDGSVLRTFAPMAKANLWEVAPRWSEDGQRIYAAAVGGKLLQIDAHTGSFQLIAALPGIEISSLVSKFDSPVSWTTDQGRYLWAIGLRSASREYAIVRIDAATGAATAIASAPLNREIEGYPNIDADAHSGEIAFVAKDQQHPSDIWIYNTRQARARQVSHLNPQLEHYALGEARIIAFNTDGGKPLHAALLLPPGYQPGRPLPTVVYVYGGEMGSDTVRTFGLVDAGPMFDMHVLATRGYAVLFPDIPITDGMPMKSIVDTVTLAVDAAVAQGFADPDRLAVMGQSYGAYSVLALITQTNRFKAAVASASVINPDLLASYLETGPDGSATSMGYFEQGQGGMGGTPWQYRDRYIANSPIYGFDKITTPLLIAQGSEDGTLSGANATFAALKRLGKEAEYRIYEGEGHVLQRKADVRDFWNRRLEFLARYLGTSDRGR